MSTPTLHEIAAMPFPESVKAMRQHYVKDWGMPVPDGATKLTYKVKLRYSYEVHGTETVQVEAFSDEEAEDKAGEALADQLTVDDLDIAEAVIVSRGDAQ